MRACRSVGFDMCPVEIVYVFSNGFLIWVVIFFSVCLDRKSWFLEKILNAQNIVFKVFWLLVLLINFCVEFLGKIFRLVTQKMLGFFFFFFVSMAGFVWILHHVVIFQCFFGKSFLIFLGKFRITWKSKML